MSEYVHLVRYLSLAANKYSIVWNNVWDTCRGHLSSNRVWRPGKNNCSLCTCCVVLWTTERENDSGRTCQTMGYGWEGCFQIECLLQDFKGEDNHGSQKFEGGCRLSEDTREMGYHWQDTWDHANMFCRWYDDGRPQRGARRRWTQWRQLHSVNINWFRFCTCYIHDDIRVSYWRSGRSNSEVVKKWKPKQKRNEMTSVWCKCLWAVTNATNDVVRGPATPWPVPRLVQRCYTNIQ